ncbi:MAG: DUF2141 domain-containing protein [Desmonostoc vinosum HA7617-LM4]|nr:DUF2141 domain-containing protein [Desmonostoc vinosum HA7617-LM4]
MVKINTGDLHMNMIHTRMWMRLLLTGIFVSLTSPSLSAQPSSVTVTLSGLRSQKGNVMVCLWKQQDKDFPICSDRASFQHVTVNPTAKVVTVKFENVPSGDYAISAFHDENKNGKIDRGFMGMPKEGIGFSNMTQEQGRPSFERAKFTLDGEKTISLSFMYL